MDFRTRLLALSLLFSVAGCASQHPGFDQQDAPQAKLSAQSYYAAGQFAESQHNWQRAIAEYRLSTTATGPHEPAYYQIAMIYTELKDYPHAIDAWKQYVNVTFGAALAYSDLAHAYELSGKYSEARTAYQAALQKEPANPTCRVNYGLMLARQGDMTGAREQLRDIYTPAQVHYQIGIVYQEQKNVSLARAEFTQAIASDPQLLDAKARLLDLDSVSSAK